MAERIPLMMRLGLRQFEREQSLIASGEEINLKDATAIQDVLRRRQKWQLQALDSVEACGEVAYGVSFLSGLISRLILFAAEQPKFKDAQPTVTENKEALAAIERLGSIVERSEIQRKLAAQLLVPGEAYLIGLQPGVGRRNVEEEWQVRSIEEAIASGTTVTLSDAPYDEHPVVLDSEKGDTWLRVWNPSLRYQSLATSHIRSILDAIDELLWWDAAARALAKNRLAMVGAIGIPQNIESPSTSDEDVHMSGAQRFAKWWQKTMTKSINEPGSSAAAVPATFTYPPNDHGKSGVEYISLKRPTDDLIEKRTDRCLKRIAQGMNLPVEVLFAQGRSARFPGGEIEQAVFREHVAPLALLVVNALTVSYLRPILRKMGVPDPDKYLIWYDASALIVRPDISQAADKGAELLMIGPPAWRRTRGFSEADAPTPEEEKRMIEILQQTRGRIPQSGPVNPADSGTPKPQGTENRQVPAAQPGGHPPLNQPAITNRGKGQPAVAPKPVSASAADLNGHAVLAAQLQLLADEKIRRALEKAGNKLFTRAGKTPSYKAAVKNVPTDRIASTLGRDAVTKLGFDGLFDNCFDTLSAQARVLVKKFFPDDDIRVKKAVSEYVTRVKAIATERLFDPPTFEMMMDEKEIISTFGLGS